MVILAAWTDARANSGGTNYKGQTSSDCDGVIDGGLMPEAQERVRSLFVHSVYDADMT